MRNKCQNIQQKHTPKYSHQYKIITFSTLLLPSPILHQANINKLKANQAINNSINIINTTKSISSNNKHTKTIYKVNNPNRNNLLPALQKHQNYYKSDFKCIIYQRHYPLNRRELFKSSQN